MQAKVLVCALFFLAMQATAHDFSYLNLYLANLKLRSEHSSDADAEYYLRVIDYPRLLKAMSTNSLPKTIENVKSELDSELVKFDENELFDISLTTPLGAFDQSKNSFELEITPSTEFLPMQMPDPTQANKKLYVVLTNTFSINEITLPPAATEEVLNTAPHLVQLRLRVKLTKAFSTGKCKGEIIKLDVLSADGKNVYITTDV